MTEVIFDDDGTLQQTSISNARDVGASRDLVSDNKAKCDIIGCIVEDPST